MRFGRGRGTGRPPRPTGVAALLLGATLLAYVAGSGSVPELELVWALLAVGVGLRSIGLAPTRALAPVPPLLALVAAAFTAPLGLVPEVAAAAAGLGYLAWLADDPWRPPAGIGRARVTLLLPGAAVGLAWASGLVLPSGAATLGVAAALLVFALGALAYLLRRPGLFDREPSASS